MHHPAYYTSNVCTATTSGRNMIPCCWRYPDAKFDTEAFCHLCGSASVDASDEEKIRGFPLVQPLLQSSYVHTVQRHARPKREPTPETGQKDFTVRETYTESINSTQKQTDQKPQFKVSQGYEIFSNIESTGMKLQHGELTRRERETKLSAVNIFCLPFLRTVRYRITWRTKNTRGTVTLPL